MTSKQPKLPLLTANNFLEWKFKLTAVLRGLAMIKMLNGEKLRDSTGKFIADDPDLKDAAMSLLAPLIHGSLVSTVTANGGDTDPIKLWQNILAFGSSKKESNLFRAYRNLNRIEIDPSNLSGSILKYRDAIAELKSLDQTLDERQTAHIILDKIPESLGSIRDAIVSTGQSSTVVTYDLVLDMLDDKAKTSSSSLAQQRSSLRVEDSEPDAASALLTYQCRNGRHDPSAKHSEAQCFAKHPRKLEEYRQRLKERLPAFSSPETHLTTAEQSAKLTNDLVASFASIAVNDPSYDSDGHESEVSLL